MSRVINSWVSGGAKWFAIWDTSSDRPVTPAYTKSEMSAYLHMLGPYEPEYSHAHPANRIARAADHGSSSLVSRRCDMRKKHKALALEYRTARRQPASLNGEIVTIRQFAEAWHDSLVGVTNVLLEETLLEDSAVGRGLYRKSCEYLAFHEGSPSPVWWRTFFGPLDQIQEKR